MTFLTEDRVRELANEEICKQGLFTQANEKKERVSKIIDRLKNSAKIQKEIVRADIFDALIRRHRMDLIKNGFYGFIEDLILTYEDKK